MKCRIRFLPIDKTCDIESGTKILVAARKNQVPIRFGCGAARCGTCAVAVSGACTLSPMDDDERNLLNRMTLSLQGDVRLSCRTKVVDGEVIVDIDFQETYTPGDYSEE